MNDKKTARLTQSVQAGEALIITGMTVFLTLVVLYIIQIVGGY